MKTEKIISRIIISGGGTGGHIYPAIAVANGLKERFKEIEILFVGALGKMEMQKVPEAGYNILGLDITGIQRRFTWKNVMVPFKLVASLKKARRVLKSFKPEVVVGFGGYASAPLLREAGTMRIPTLLQEQNSHAGITNKLLAKRAAKICVAYEGMEKYFPKEKIVITGNPVRSDIIGINNKTHEGFQRFQLKQGVPTLLVLGGSLGARTINNSVLAGLNLIRQAHIQVLWQTGNMYFNEMMEKTAQKEVHNVRVVEFIKEMNEAYAIADVIISRAGALSISELQVVGKPVIFVPSPNVAEDHQTKNALAMVEKNAALMIPDNEAEGQLIGKALELMADHHKRAELAENIKNEARPKATEQIVEQILSVVR